MKFLNETAVRHYPKTKATIRPVTLTSTPRNLQVLSHPSNKTFVRNLETGNTRFGEILTKWNVTNLSKISIRSMRQFSQITGNGSVTESLKPWEPSDTFEKRHIGPTSKDAEEMLKVIGCSSLEELIEKVVPETIRRTHKPDALQKNTSSAKFGLNVKGKSESEALNEIKSLADKNILLKSFIGQGYYGTKTPSVILRNMLENPAWYTAYTPYQSEVSQGRLEMLLNFQTMLRDLTKMDVANCSLLDEGTAAAEAMNLSYSQHRGKRLKYFVSKDVFAQTIGCIKTRAQSIGVSLVVGAETDLLKMSPEQLKEFSGACLQSPNKYGELIDGSKFAQKLQENGVLFCMATDLLSDTVARPPGEDGADVVVGSAQRFGVPMFYGGPHAGFMCVKEKYTRLMPGRLIGVSVDSNGKQALRMALQTREQFIKREKATSNICTAQALLANIAAAYSIYHGPHGLKEIGSNVNQMANVLLRALSEAKEFTILSKTVFDTVSLKLNSPQAVEALLKAAASNGFNVHAHRDMKGNLEGVVSITVDETTTEADLVKIIATLTKKQKDAIILDKYLTKGGEALGSFKRSSGYLEHPVFNSHHSETKMLRYLASLEAKDVTLRNSMIPLGSCTMKLNGTSELIPVSWPQFKDMHPFSPVDQTKGYFELIEQLNSWLAKVTGFAKVSSQPNSGASGEYAGLLTIKKYHEKRGESHRNICLIPSSAHGTNPASAVLAGMEVIGVKNDADGRLDMDDYKAKVAKYKSNLACLMITYPSTYGVFEKNVKEIISICKTNGGLVYMDGANMNAQLGICSPGEIGADVCHLNLHKTFAIPHGGGGPGVGSIGVSDLLKDYLPNHAVVNLPADYSGDVAKDNAIGQVAAAPFGSAGILPIPWMYINMMGEEGLLASSRHAILNANYMAKELSKHFGILFLNENKKCGHEFILDLRYLAKHGLSEGDVAKRLADYGFHAPTMSWPVAGTMMIEPTESESKDECDRFIAAMINIKKEIDQVVKKEVPVEASLLHNAPHSLHCVMTEEGWNSKPRSYTREHAVFPLSFVKRNKMWPNARVDNVYGDRNLVCSCPSVDSYNQ